MYRLQSTNKSSHDACPRCDAVAGRDIAASADDELGTAGEAGGYDSTPQICHWPLSRRGRCENPASRLYAKTDQKIITSFIVPVSNNLLERAQRA